MLEKDNIQQLGTMQRREWMTEMRVGSGEDGIMSDERVKNARGDVRTGRSRM